MIEGWALWLPSTDSVADAFSIFHTSMDGTKSVPVWPLGYVGDYSGRELRNAKSGNSQDIGGQIVRAHFYGLYQIKMAAGIAGGLSVFSFL